MWKLDYKISYLSFQFNWLSRIEYKTASWIFSQMHKNYITCPCLFDPSRTLFYLFESFFDDFECAWPSPAECFFPLGAPPVAESTNGPDQVWIGAFEYVKWVELNGTSGGSKTGSIWCEEPKGKPSVPSWCGGGNFSLLLFAFACVISRLLCHRK